MLKFFRLPFATTGDKTAVPDAVDSNGNVSYSQGYGFDYQRQKTDPAAKNIERDKMNQVFFDMTTAIAELQSQGVPDFITTALNGGTAYSYAQYAVVKYSGGLYISLVAANTALPSDATKWALLPTPARIQSAFNSSAVAAGTADALTGAFSPAIAALPAAPGTLSLFVRAGSANATTTPTFKADGTTAKTIVKGANQALVAGDIAGAGHWLELQYDATLDKWVLQNPAFGVSTPAPHGQLLRITRYTAAGSGTWTKQADTNSILVQAVGGGGGGGGATSASNQSGNGGNSGCYGVKLITAPSASYAYVVGAGGEGGAVNASGSGGGQTSFGALTLAGGFGGSQGLGAIPALATGSGWDFTSASPGAPGFADSGSNIHGQGGTGGPSPFAGGGSQMGGGSIAGNYGSGGGGGSRPSATAAAGTAGGIGYIEVWEFA